MGVEDRRGGQKRRSGRREVEGDNSAKQSVNTRIPERILARRFKEFLQLSTKIRVRGRTSKNLLRPYAPKHYFMAKRNQFSYTYSSARRAFAPRV